MIVEQIDFNKAFLVSSRVHKGQVRDGTNEPYISHPLAVSQILIDYGRPRVEVIAGILHDTIEDIKGDSARSALIEEILKDFGFEVLQLVKGVTKISKKEDGNRRDRVKIDIYHYVMASAGSHNVKIADVMHNLSDVATLDQGFARKYIREKDWLISEFEKNGKADAEMLRDVRTLINKLLVQFK